ncbi:uncharacterized protein K460DRAFT_353187 [Cucurbitaria berberidis CBS 394.84]|uniref:Uncharacterized protein n=1 Tax=Cucurbitaria berberidis CBS 394.84 TaxID=1168544 RepID=A0A9P4GMZ4_9PLEO|nr:uncharacterized protein K460DRAFT_353187 [Cucurbitaria berberidis CBS 394.84]KAF1848169.1 hypothetical protein K460DRAFT_353187 [Cucurbitaria berberidis CBS 394.84]
MPEPSFIIVDDVATTIAIRDSSRLLLDHLHKALARNQAATPDPRSLIQPQQASRLLSLPTELRLMICKYMTLSPASADSLAWKGAYFACRQLQNDMRAELKPEQDLAKYIASNHASWQPDITVGLRHPQLNLIRDIAVHTPIPGHGYDIERFWSKTMSSLYALYLNHLQVILTGCHFYRLPYYDLKSWRSHLFIDYVGKGKVHCKKVTFTIDELANEMNGRKMCTRIANVIPGTKILYLMEIVQDGVGRQTERVYSSEVRFRPLPLRN